ncbi:MAG: anion permease, partial [Clostridia bacterium]|nr:anion permease [Clostridia bacterium]
MKKVIEFIKKETVLIISAMLAVFSMFFVPPSLGYIEYIDLKTISLLFCLMAVMAGLREIGVFSALANTLLEKTKNFRTVTLIQIMLCIFTSMLVTNDVALITFVPFAIEVVKKSDKNKFMVPIVVLQTIAANLGSMLTPVGNPQNLYLYSLSGMSLGAFVLLVLPYTAISLVLLVIANFTIKSSSVDYKTEKIKFSAKSTVFYLVLFLVCMLTVANVLEYWVTFIIVTVAVLIINRKLILKVDYSLLLTFIFFFIFIGNMSNVDAF